MFRQEAKQTMRLVYKHALETLLRDLDFAERKLVNARDLQERALAEIQVRQTRKQVSFAMSKAGLIH